MNSIAGHIAPAGAQIGRATPRILRATEPSPATWPAALGRATTQGFDTLLLPGRDVPLTLAQAASGLGIALLADVEIDRAPMELAAAGPFTSLLAPSIDPRHDPAPAPFAHAAIGTDAAAAALAAFWAPRLLSMRDAGIAGARLLGLTRIPGWSVAPFLESLRAACPGVVLFGWTPGLPWPVLHAIPPRTLDLVAGSLPWWDGKADWLWRELDMLRRIAPVVSDGGDHPTHQAFAAMLSEGWMTTAADDAEALNRLRATTLSGLPWSAPVDHGRAILRTDAPDLRQARHAAIAVLHPVPPERLAAAGGGHLTPFEPALTLPGLSVHVARARPEPATPPLARKRAETAAAAPRLAIESPSPCVENGRFPARLVVGTVVPIEADVIGDGHDKLAVMLRWRGPGHEDWTEIPMLPLGNDRFRAAIILDRLGAHEYVIEAWRDAWATYTDELEKKYKAGISIALELREGAALVQAAADRAKKPARTALAEVLAVLAGNDPDAARTILLAPETRDAMARADDRPHCVATAPLPLQAERAGAAFASWYEVFPRSLSDDETRHGTFRDVVRHLPRIQAMGFDVLYFPPIHPIGRKNRKGRNNTLTPTPEDPGSPYAIGSEDGGHDAIHPELGTIEDFQHLRMKAAEHGIELAIDFAIQCSPDHPWLKQHKDWFTWRPDGSIRYAENPPKKYEDIVNVDFYAPGAIPDLWLALANAVLYWASQGVRLFRVDNPHTKPLPFWEWMIAEVQSRYPDSVFLAEAFTRPKVMYRLAKVGFSQSYTYFTWRNSKQEFVDYLTELADGPPRDFFRPHFFVNTPDINPVPLQTAPRSGFLTRAALAATLSGLWGVYNGFELCDATPIPGKEEYLDSEKYQLRAWDWDRPGNIVAEIAQLNAIRRMNPALQTHLGVTFLDADNDQVLLFEKATPDRSNVLLVAINMDLHTPQTSRISIPFWRWTPEPASLHATDLLTDRHERWTSRDRVVSLTSDRPYAIWRITPPRPSPEADA